MAYIRLGHVMHTTSYTLLVTMNYVFLKRDLNCLSIKMTNIPKIITNIDMYNGNSKLISYNVPATSGPIKFPILVNVEFNPPAKPCLLPAIFEK